MCQSCIIFCCICIGCILERIISYSQHCCPVCCIRIICYFKFCITQEIKACLFYIVTDGLEVDRLSKVKHDLLSAILHTCDRSICCKVSVKNIIDVSTSTHITACIVLCKITGYCLFTNKFIRYCESIPAYIHCCICIIIKSDITCIGCLGRICYHCPLYPIHRSL